jgi:hypothetical protein
VELNGAHNPRSTRVTLPALSSRLPIVRNTSELGVGSGRLHGLDNFFDDIGHGLGSLLADSGPMTFEDHWRLQPVRHEQQVLTDAVVAMRNITMCDQQVCEANTFGEHEHWRTLFAGVRRTNTNTPLKGCSCVRHRGWNGKSSSLLTSDVVVGRSPPSFVQQLLLRF